MARQQHATRFGGGERHLGMKPGCALLDATRSLARVTHSGDARANTSGAGRESPHQPRIVYKQWYGQRRPLHRLHDVEHTPGVGGSDERRPMLGGTMTFTKVAFCIRIRAAMIDRHITIRSTMVLLQHWLRL